MKNTDGRWPSYYLAKRRSTHVGARTSSEKNSWYVNLSKTRKQGQSKLLFFLVLARPLYPRPLICGPGGESETEFKIAIPDRRGGEKVKQGDLKAVSRNCGIIIQVGTRWTANWARKLPPKFRGKQRINSNCKQREKGLGRHRRNGGKLCQRLGAEMILRYFYPFPSWIPAKRCIFATKIPRSLCDLYANKRRVSLVK